VKRKKNVIKHLFISCINSIAEALLSFQFKLNFIEITFSYEYYKNC